MVYNFYSKEHPETEEIVLVQFTEKCDSFFKGYLKEYEYVGIMTFQDTTKKKKIQCWNKILTFNKDMIAKIIDVDMNSKIVQLSILYMPDDINMEYFNDNRQLEQLIKSFCFVHNYDFMYIWTILVYYIDIQRRNHMHKESINNINIWVFFNTHIKLLKEWISQSFSDENFINLLYSQLLSYYDKRIKNSTYVYITKLEIISNDGIIKLKYAITNILKNSNFKYEIKYLTTPYYNFETSSLNTTEDQHKLLISYLIEEIKKNDFLVSISMINFSKK